MLAVPLLMTALAVAPPAFALAVAPPAFTLAGPAPRLGGLVEADARIAGAVILLVAVAAALFLVRRVRRAAGRGAGALDERAPGREGEPR